ncbi:MAG: hypothetical protein V4723_11305 [Pseudomonadota bacterium]
MKLSHLMLASCTVGALSACSTAPVVVTPPPAASAPVPSGPPESEVFLADLDLASATVSGVKNISRNKGYDNQPSFTPDARAVWFVSDRTGTPDVFRYDIASAQTVQVTATREAEFSPTPLPDRAGFSATHVAAPDQKGEAYTESQQLWRYSVDGKPLMPVLKMGRIGYHAWLDGSKVALFIVGSEARKLDNSLVLADVVTGATTTLATKVGRSLGRTPDGKRISFVDKRDNANWVVVAMGPGDSRPTLLVATPKGPAGEAESERSEDYAWLPDGGLLMAKDGRLMRWDGKPGSALSEFAVLKDLDGPVKRLAVSRDGKRLAFVVQKR